MDKLQRVDMRADAETLRLLDALREQLGLFNRSAAIRYAVRRAAQLEGLPIEGGLLDGLHLRPGPKRRASAQEGGPDA